MRLFLITALVLFVNTSCGKKESEHDEQLGITNLDAVLAANNLTSYSQSGFTGRNLKIAILDNGFLELDKSKGVTLPDDLTVRGHSVENANTTNHGTRIAEIVYSLATGRRYYDASVQGPTLLLYNTNGVERLSAAVDQLIAERVDMVVYAQIWEFGGNLDGTGFINAIVNRATSAGILWINAVGNYGKTTFSFPINFLNDSSRNNNLNTNTSGPNLANQSNLYNQYERPSYNYNYERRNNNNNFNNRREPNQNHNYYRKLVIGTSVNTDKTSSSNNNDYSDIQDQALTVSLPYEQKYLRFFIEENATPVQIVLSWNDFTDDPNYATTQDLDLYLEDSESNIIEVSNFVQNGTVPQDSTVHSKYARESINTLLQRGIYHLRVTAKSNQFNSNSYLWFAIATGDGHVISSDNTTSSTASTNDKTNWRRDSLKNFFNKSLNEFRNRSLKIYDNSYEDKPVVLIPADNPSVLAVGCNDVDFSTVGYTKNSNILRPDMSVSSNIQFASSENYTSTSGAAAVAAVILAVYMDKNGKLSKDQLLNNIDLLTVGKTSNGLVPVVRLP